MKEFINKHPFVSLLMVATICETAIVLTKTITKDESPFKGLVISKKSPKKKKSTSTETITIESEERANEETN